MTVFDLLLKSPLYLGITVGLVGLVIAGLIAYMQFAVKKAREKSSERKSDVKHSDKDEEDIQGDEKRTGEQQKSDDGEGRASDSETDPLLKE